MCGRFARYSLKREIERYFNLDPAALEIAPRYNIAPIQEIPVIIQDEGGRQLKMRHWGLVPFWAKDISIGSRMINARVETIASKPAFKAAIKHRRCLIPADGFYEWKGKAGDKQPFYFCLSSGEPLAFAGLWEAWQDKEAPPDSTPYTSFAIITTEASSSVRDVHHRMPLILKPEFFGDWLDQQTKDAAKIEGILKKGCMQDLKRYPISKRVNNVGNDSKECIEPLGSARE